MESVQGSTVVSSHRTSTISGELNNKQRSLFWNCPPSLILCSRPPVPSSPPYTSSLFLSTNTFFPHLSKSILSNSHISFQLQVTAAPPPPSGSPNPKITLHYITSQRGGIVLSGLPWKCKSSCERPGGRGWIQFSSYTWFPQVDTVTSLSKVAIFCTFSAVSYSSNVVSWWDTLQMLPSCIKLCKSFLLISPFPICIFPKFSFSFSLPLIS